MTVTRNMKLQTKPASVLLLFLLLCSVLFLLITVSCDDPTTPDSGTDSPEGNFLEDFDDGDYDGWSYHEDWSYSEGSHAVEVSDGALKIERREARGAHGIFGIEQDVSIPVDDSTEIMFDIQAAYSNVRGGSGDNNTEFPANISLTLATDDGEKTLRFAYNYRGGSDKEFEDGYQVGIGDAPEGEWLREEKYRITDYFPTASEVTNIDIFSKGWDYTGYVDNLVIGISVERVSSRSGRTEKVKGLIRSGSLNEIVNWIIGNKTSNERFGVQRSYRSGLT